MFGRLLLLFTIVPVVELYLLITLGGVLGTVPTVGLVLVTGLVGAWLAKREGGRVLREWQGAVQQGKMPKEGLTSSLLVLVGGVLLVTPGVLTDLAGLAMLFAPTRRAIAALVQRNVQAKLAVSTFSVSPLGAFAGSQSDAYARGEASVIEVDATEGDVDGNADAHRAMD